MDRRAARPYLARHTVGVTDPAPYQSGLPPRPPRPFIVHWGVDTLIAFVAVLFLALIAGFALTTIVIAALVVGLVAAQFTRQAEIRALAARDAAREDQ